MAIGLTRQVNDRFGALFVGLDATPTGTDANFLLVADFTGATATQFPDMSTATVVSHTPSQTNGSIFHINVAGLWLISAEVPVATAATVLSAINVDGIAADLLGNPAAANVRNRRFNRWVGTAAGEADTKELHAALLVTEAMARDPLGLAGAVRLLLGNGAAAGATAASLAVLTNARIQFDWMGAVPPGT